RGVYDIGAESDQDGIAVRCGLCGLPRRDIAAGSADVLNVKLLSEPLAQSLCHQTREDIGRSTPRETDDQADRPARIVLRGCRLRPEGKSAGSACKAKKMTARFHDWVCSAAMSFCSICL